MILIPRHSVSGIHFQKTNTVLCEFIVQELKDGAKIPDAIREELNDLLYLYIEPKQEA